MQLEGVEDNEVKQINYDNRTPHTFNYQIETKVEARFSNRNPIELKIGLIYINDNIFNVTPLTSALKNLVYNSNLFPEYVQFKNPHHNPGQTLKQSVNYWSANLQMPKEHYTDYDILIIAGYGQKDLTSYAENIQAFVDTGGLLIIDNNGVGTSVLDFKNDAGKQTFIANVGFSKTSVEVGNLKYGLAPFANRYFNQVPLVGVGGGPNSNFAQIEFLENETSSDWTGLITHPSNRAALALKETSGGRIMLSNMHLMSDLIYNNTITKQMLVNLIMYYTENKTFKTPLFKEQVLHKDDLFEEDYKDEFGKELYIDDQNDQDGTQIVAKKQLATTVSEVANRYLPYAYQRPINAEYLINVADNSSVTLANSGFESNSATKKWTDTKLDALPGYRFVVTSKGTIAEGGLSTSLFKSGRQSGYVKTGNSKAFFEQEIPDLIAGDYILEASVRTDGSTSGGLSIYNFEANLIEANETVSGNTGWQTIYLYFTLPTTQTVYLRFGSSQIASTGTIYFDDIVLNSQGVVQMTPSGVGGQPLYAYAVKPRGQNHLIGNHLTENHTIVRSQQILEPTILIQSFVYVWDVNHQNYRKSYGRENYVKVAVSKADQEKVVRNLIELVPGNEAGYQWNYDQNIFYEIKLYDTGEITNYINLSIFDPSTQTHFFSSNGEWIINREDLWHDGLNSTVQLRVQSIADSFQITGAKYDLMYPNDKKIALHYPATHDERDRWYPRIENGSFTKVDTSTKDWEDVSESGRENFYNEYVVGQQQYAVPEYYRQSFYPRTGERLIEGETAQYLNPTLIQVSHHPLIVAERQTEVTLFNFEKDKKTFRAFESFWDKDEPIAIYHDEERILSGYEIDFEEGVIVFDRVVADTVIVRAHVTLNNIRVIKRKLSNSGISNERLTLVDDNTLDFKHRNIAVSPNPVFYRDGQIVHPAEYWIDFKVGQVHFYQDNRKNICADYSYYIEEDLMHTDINRYTGEIKLAKPIHFRDEIVVDYIYEENNLEYKGYYDEELGIFQHLDLNPTTGHTYTAKRYDEEGQFLEFYEETSEKLLNKEIFFYLLPSFSNYYDKVTKEENPMRHALGEKEWQTIKSAYPHAMLIGRIQVRENTTINNAVVMDARRLGGGLKENIDQAEIEKRIGYTSAFWDIGGFDGMAYYRNGVTVIQLPEDILLANGGGFTEDEIERILSKYLALGVYPIIEYLPRIEEPIFAYSPDEERPEMAEERIGDYPAPIEDVLLDFPELGYD